LRAQALAGLPAELAYIVISFGSQDLRVRRQVQEVPVVARGGGARESQNQRVTAVKKQILRWLGGRVLNFYHVLAEAKGEQQKYLSEFDHLSLLNIFGRFIFYILKF
jgi:hypothetical protein